MNPPIQATDTILFNPLPQFASFLIKEQLLKGKQLDFLSSLAGRYSSLAFLSQEEGDEEYLKPAFFIVGYQEICIECTLENKRWIALTPSFKIDVEKGMAIGEISILNEKHGIANIDLGFDIREYHSELLDVQSNYNQGFITKAGWEAAVTDIHIRFNNLQGRWGFEQPHRMIGGTAKKKS